MWFLLFIYVVLVLFFCPFPCMRSQDLMMGCVSVPFVCVIDGKRDGGGTGCAHWRWGGGGCELLGCQLVHYYLSPSALCFAVSGSVCMLYQRPLGTLCFTVCICQEPECLLLSLQEREREIVCV